MLVSLCVSFMWIVNTSQFVCVFYVNTSQFVCVFYVNTSQFVCVFYVNTSQWWGGGGVCLLCEC